ncbi:YbfB/YjiJ family MFS transporter [Teichococcus wenyumeiae]|nr:YbfB/YjiJ family MFS transporter [Pseudoroseomonas wenyumeiae]
MMVRTKLHPAALAAGACLLSGIGLARFGYVPMFPAMVEAGWVGGAGGGLLGACNFAGYLLGAMLGRRMGRWLGVPGALDLCMGLLVLSFLACGWQGGLAWLAFWRALAGFGGGVLMAVSGPAAQAVVPPAQRGLAGGVLTSGVGGGAALSAVAVPLLLQGGVALAWAGMAALVALIWLAARPYWPNPSVETLALPRGQALPPAGWLLGAYVFSAAGMVPPMVYTADLAVRGHGAGAALAGLLWVLFGIGGVAGTLSGGATAGRIGAMPAARLWLLLQVAAMAAALVPVGWGPWALLLTAPLSGFAGLGLTAVTLAGAREIAGPASAILWARATVLYALTQAITGFLLAALFRWSGDQHAAVFGTGLLLSAIGLAVAVLAPRRASPVS